MALQWLTLIATIWLQSINGTNSNFPAYSSHFKKVLSISQLQLNNLASASDAGKLLGWFSGVAARHLPLWLVLLIGAALGLVGYGVQYMFMAGHVHTLSYWHVFILTVLAGNSICWINTVCYILAIHNFPFDRHLAIGLSTSYVGLSAKLYNDMVDVIINDGSSAERARVLLILNSVAPLVVCVLASPLARKEVSGGKSRSLAGGFLILFVITVVTGLFAVITSLGRFLGPLVVAAGLFVFLLLPLVTPLEEKVRERVQRKCSRGDRKLDCVGREEIGSMMMLRGVEFWLYFFAYLFGTTTGLVYLNNLGQIAESRGCSGTSSLVSLASAFGFFGRLLPSLVDFYFFSRKKHVVSTTIAMGVMMTPMCGALFLITIIQHDIALYVATAIIGTCTGAITSISVSMTTELFGANNFGVNHNIVVSNIPIGSFLFGDIAALIYNMNKGAGQDSCMGHKCYQTTFMVWGILAVLGTVLAFILHSRHLSEFEKKHNSPPPC